MKEILNRWVKLNQIFQSDIPHIAEIYLKEVKKSNEFSVINTLMSSGMYQMIDWNSALEQICRVRNYQLYSIYDKNGNLIMRFFNEKDIQKIN